MADFQLLNTKTHDKLRVSTRYKSEYGYAQGATMVLPVEIRNAQRDYPILFRKHPETGRFFPNVLLGFDQDENLFIDSKGKWHSRYVPWSMEKGPFMIGFQNKTEGNSDPVVYIDVADPRVGTDEGELLFLKDGALSQYMSRMSHILLSLHEGVGDISKMVDAFVRHELIEPVKIDIEFVNGEKLNFAGGYTISTEKLEAISIEQLADLHQSGFLACAYYIADSLDNIRKLIGLRNIKTAAETSATS